MVHNCFIQLYEYYDRYSGSKNYPSTLYSSFLTFFFALWKATSKLLLVTSCSTLCLVYICYSFQLCISFSLYFPKKRKDTHKFFITKNYPYKQRKCRLCLLKNLLISEEFSRMFWNILVEISRTFTMNIDSKLYC